VILGVIEEAGDKMKYRLLHSTRSKMASLALILALGSAGSYARAESPVSASEAAEDLEKLNSTVVKLRRELDIVAQGYGTPIENILDAGLERRLREGEVHFLLNDFLRASIVLMDAVENPENRSHPRYDECLYFLAESLRRTGNFTGARAFFEDLVTRATGDRLREVVVALLEIADATGRYDGVEVYVDRLRRGSASPSPVANYIFGKTLFRGARGNQTQLSRALEVFSEVPAGTDASAKASYYAGVTLLQLGRTQEAVAKFQEASGRAASAIEAKEIRELSQMALGRVHYELGEVSQAVDAYQDIDENSGRFSDMLFEVAWSYVKASNQNTEDQAEKARYLDMALRMSELLMASAPDHRLFPEARILEGNLQIRLGAPETAYDTFQSIIDRYGGAQSKLKEIRDTLENPTEFFEQLVEDKSRTSAASAMLPSVAVDWAVKSSDVREAVETMRELRVGKTYLRESRSLVRAMQEALKGEQRYAMFTGLGDARARSYSIENQIILANRKMLSLERRMILPFASKKNLAQLDLMSARRRNLEDEVQALPSNTKQIVEVTAQITNTYEKTEKRVFRQTYKVASMRAQVAAVEIWLSENRNSLTDKEIALMSKRTRAARRDLVELESEIEDLEDEISTAQTVSAGDGGRVRAKRLREAYAVNIEREVAQLKTMRGKIPAEFNSSVTNIDGARGKLSSIGSDLQVLQRALDRQISSKVNTIRERLKIETEKLNRFEQEQVALAQQTKDLLGPVAMASLEGVMNEFNDLVMKADVGIIDVAWARKEEKTKRVNAAVDDEQQSLRNLAVEYSEFAEDE
jgi:tetratricopeptide (TPR) repeat protein